MGLQPLPAVCLKEEFGIGEPRPDDPLIAVSDNIRILRIRITDGNEIGEELAPLLKRETALMRPHHGNQYILWKGQIGLVKSPADGYGIFCQEGDLFK